MFFAELQNLMFSRVGRLWCGDDASQPVELIPMAWHASPGPLETSLEYFYNKRQSENRKMIALRPDSSDWLPACWVLKSVLTHMIIKDRVRGPFPICHLDLHSGNMLFDDECTLTRIIDWDSAQAAPPEQLSVCPELNTFPDLSDEENRPVVESKDLVIESLKEMEGAHERRPPLDDPEVDMSLSLNQASLSTYLASKSAVVTYWLYMSSPKVGFLDGKVVSELLYGENVTWE